MLVLMTIYECDFSDIMELNAIVCADNKKLIHAEINRAILSYYRLDRFLYLIWLLQLENNKSSYFNCRQIV